VICRHALQSVVEPAERDEQRLPMACYLYIVLGQVYLEWNELEEAARCLERGINRGELTTIERPILVEGYCVLARLHSIEGHVQRALTLIDKAEQTMALWLGGEGDVPALRVRVWLRHARFEGKRRYLDRAIAWVEAHPLQQTGEYSPAAQTVLRVRIAQRQAYGAPDLEPLLRTLVEQIELAQASGRVSWQIEALALKALALQAQGQIDDAAEFVVRALALAAPEHFVQTFLEHGAPMGELLRLAARQDAVRAYAQELLAALAGGASDERSSEQGPSLAALVEPLTLRELEVLALIATGASNPEIARDLYISVNTVKRHVTNIFGKLGVTSRTHAAARGRELGIVD
jgi:LuxR family maltose regulon positive regulatory protein